MFSGRPWSPVLLFLLGGRGHTVSSRSATGEAKRWIEGRIKFLLLLLGRHLFLIAMHLLLASLPNWAFFASSKPLREASLQGIPTLLGITSLVSSCVAMAPQRGEGSTHIRGHTRHQEHGIGKRTPPSITGSTWLCMAFCTSYGNWGDWLGREIHKVYDYRYGSVPVGFGVCDMCDHSRGKIPKQDIAARQLSKPTKSSIQGGTDCLSLCSWNDQSQAPRERLLDLAHKRAARYAPCPEHHSTGRSSFMGFLRRSINDH